MNVSRWISTIALVGITTMSAGAIAQTEERRGTILYNQALEFREATTTLSSGTLAQLRTDLNFAGDLQAIVNAAGQILDGYRVVNRRGFFPENRNIPQESQLLRAEAVYRIFSLENGYELFLFRSPTQNTSEYIIRSIEGRSAPAPAVSAPEISPSPGMLSNPEVSPRPIVPPSSRPTLPQ